MDLNDSELINSFELRLCTCKNGRVLGGKEPLDLTKTLSQLGLKAGGRVFIQKVDPRVEEAEKVLQESEYLRDK